MFVVEVGSVLTTLLWVRDLIAHPAGAAPRLVHRCGDALALVHGALRQLRRGGGRGARQGPGRRRCARCARRRRRGGCVGRARRSRCRPPRCARATWWWSRPASSSPATARSSRASPRSTSRPSPASRRRSSARVGRRPLGGHRRHQVLSDRIVVRITADPGESFLDRMIALVEGAARQKTPNEIALHILLVGLTIVFLFACVTLVPLAAYSRHPALGDGHRGAARLPHPDHHRRPALGHRHRRHGPAAAQERPRHERPRGRGGRRRGHAAARQDRHHHPRQPHGHRASSPSPGVRVEELADAAQLASLADETPGGALHRGAGQGAASACAAATLAGARRALRPLHARRPG